MPRFDQYVGASCPTIHLRMFVQAMTGHTHDERLLVHCFQASLAGPAKQWYYQQKSADMQTWGQLAQAFFKHYKHLTDFGPDRQTLQNMKKYPNESFRQYAQRWRISASQVQPPLTEKELSKMFINTLQAPFFDKLISNVTRDFADVVMAGESVENAIRIGKISEPIRKHGNEVNMVGQSRHPRPTLCQNPSARKRRRIIYEKAKVDPIPTTYTELLPRLVQNNMVNPVYSEVGEPAGECNAAVTCGYHIGCTTHCTEDRGALKQKVQELIEVGLLKF